MIISPWTATLTQPEHDLIMFGLVAAGLALLATLVRVRFTSRESYGAFRVASMTANAVVAIAFLSYVALVLAFVLGYRATGTGSELTYVPTAVARYAWAFRYMDWVVTVPLLVLELAAVSAMSDIAVRRFRVIGTTSAALMITSGFLGAFIVSGGSSLVTYSVLGMVGALFFAVLYILFFTAMLRSLPRLPDAARTSYRAAIVLLLVTWLIYPMTYGFFGVIYGGVAAVVGQLALCAADLIAKVGFGTLIHRTAVLRSRSEEDLDPGRPSRPRAPINDSVYVSDSRALDLDRE